MKYGCGDSDHAHCYVVGIQAGAERQLLKSTHSGVASLISSLVFYLVDKSSFSLTDLVRLVSL